MIKPSRCRRPGPHTIQLSAARSFGSKRFPASHGSHLRNRQGSAAILFVALMSVIVIIGAFAVDYAYMELAQTELRIATDLSTRAASAEFGASQDVDAARAKAIEYALKNRVGGRLLKLKDSDIKVGRSERSSNGKYEFVEGARPYNSFRVVADMSAGSESGALRTFFQNFHAKEFELSAESIVTEVNLDIVLILDRSGSMAFDLSGTDWQYPDRYGYTLSRYLRPPITGSRWEALEGAVDAFLEEMGYKEKKERVAVVSYSSNYGPVRYRGRRYRANEVETNHEFSIDYGSIEDSVRAIGAKPVIGGTAISSGIDRGRSLLRSSTNHGATDKIMILMTDGEWNVGYDPVQAARSAAAEDVKIYTISFGRNSGGPTMRSIADLTGGDFYAAATAAELEQAFRDIARSIGLTFTR